MANEFLPVNREDMEKRGWDACDFVYVCGDAYVDHPSFGHAIISRLLESQRLPGGHDLLSRTGNRKRALPFLDEPRLGFLVSAGNMDSMVNHYSVSKRRRAEGFLHARRRHGTAARIMRPPFIVI